MTRSKLSTSSLAVAVALGGAAAAQVADSRPEVPVLEKPFKVMSGGEPIAVTTGHAAPFVYDFNRDGKRDLIVGEFGTRPHRGRARIYLNVGTDAKPVFEGFEYLKSGDEFASVPSS